jgi:hypothetical protein
MLTWEVYSEKKGWVMRLITRVGHVVSLGKLTKPFLISFGLGRELKEGFDKINKAHSRSKCYITLDSQGRQLYPEHSD